MTDGDVRLARVIPVADGLIDAVRARDRRWVESVCMSVVAGKVDWEALIVCLAARAAERE